MDRNLQKPAGQTLPWYVYDPTNTLVDPIYDVGDTPSGRRWKSPVLVPALGVIKLEAQEIRNDDGFYVVDTIEVYISPDTARAVGLSDIIWNPDNHDIDRVVYENKVFTITQVRVRGALVAGYAIVVAQGVQVKNEELVNDPQFYQYWQVEPNGGVPGPVPPGYLQ